MAARSIIICLSLALVITLCGLAVCITLILLQTTGHTDVLSPQETTQDKHLPPACVQDYLEYSRKYMKPVAWAYLSQGAGMSTTTRDNVCAYRKWNIRAKKLVNVNGYSAESTMLGRKVAAPIGVAPSGYHHLFHPDAEIATARGAEAANMTMVLSVYSSTSLEDVRKAAPRLHLWPMMHVLTDREISLAMIRRAEAADCQAIVLAMDKPVRDIRRWKKHYDTAELWKPPARLDTNLAPINSSFRSYNHALYGQNTATWEDLAWFVQQTQLPIVIKGIMGPRDAARALRAGVRGILVSNHGGRTLDGEAATIDVLKGVVQEAAGRAEVYIDGGIKSGMDIFRALALGADGVFVGRAPLYGLFKSGEVGVSAVLGTLSSELANTMAYAGVTSVRDVTSECVEERENDVVLACRRDLDLP